MFENRGGISNKNSWHNHPPPQDGPINNFAPPPAPGPLKWYELALELVSVSASSYLQWMAIVNTRDLQRDAIRWEQFCGDVVLDSLTRHTEMKAVF